MNKSCSTVSTFLQGDTIKLVSVSFDEEFVEKIEEGTLSGLVDRTCDHYAIWFYYFHDLGYVFGDIFGFFEVGEIRTAVNKGRIVEIFGYGLSEDRLWDIVRHDE